MGRTPGFHPGRHGFESRALTRVNLHVEEAEAEMIATMILARTRQDHRSRPIPALDDTTAATLTRLMSTFDEP